MGIKVRLRFGGQARERFEINTNDSKLAASRAVRMQAAIAALVRVQVDRQDILDILTTMAEQATESAFAKIEKRAFTEAEEAQKRSNEPAPPARALAYTMNELFHLWTSGELHRRYPANKRIGFLEDEQAKKAKQRWAKMAKVIGSVALADMTQDKANDAIAVLPKMAKTTLGQHQALIRRVLNLAVELNLLQISPLKSTWAGSVKSDRVNCHLNPVEDRQLLACQAIEFAYRLLWGFLAREGCRLDEALDAKWRHYDIASGNFRIDKHKTRKRGAKPRTFMVEAGTRAALRWWHFELQRQGKAGLDDPIFPGLDIDERTGSKLLRETHLGLAGITRPELFENNEHRMWFHVHSLRVTFVTLALAAGWSEFDIMAKTGHANSDQLHGYNAGADLMKRNRFTDFLAPLDEALGLTKGAADNDGSDQSAGVNDGAHEAVLGTTGTRGPDMLVTLGVGQGVGQNSRNGMFSAGPGGLPQTPNADNGLPAPCDSGYLAPVAGSSTQLGPPQQGGVGQTGVGQVDAVLSEETALANAIHNASQKGQWQVVQVLAGLLGERQRARLAPDVPTLDAARAKKGVAK